MDVRGTRIYIGVALKLKKKYFIYSVPNNCFIQNLKLVFYSFLNSIIYVHFFGGFFFRSHIKSGPHKSGFVSFSFRITVQNPGSKETCKICSLKYFDTCVIHVLSFPSEEHSLLWNFFNIQTFLV